MQEKESNSIGKKVEDTEFVYHFSMLDSVATKNPNDSIYDCCTQSVKFMEINTGIDAHSDGTLVGKLSFSKSDLSRWHEWYDKKKNNVK